MAIFSELDLTTFNSGKIEGIMPNTVAERIGLQVGDELLAIDENPIEDVIDVQFYTATESFELTIRRGEEILTFEVWRDYGESLGIEFNHPTFDTDIRRCNNLCEFCFVLQMAPRFRRTLYVKDDDYRYSFLQGHFVTLTNLTDHDWWRIETMGLSPLYVSVHVTDTELRRQFLRNDTAPDIITQLKWLAERGIEVHTQLVVVPEFNDGESLKRSVDELAALWPHVASISVVPVGLTKQHKYKMRTHTTQEASDTLAYVESLQPEFQEKFGSRFVYPTDEWYIVADRDVPEVEAYDGQSLEENGLGMVRRFLDEWAGVKEEIGEWKGEKALPKNILLTTGELFGDILTREATQFSELTGVGVTVVPIENNRLGNSITAAGLLMAQDISEQAMASDKFADADIIVLPRVTFDHPDTISLDDYSPQRLANELQKTVALADTMGDVWDACIGESQVMFWPEKDVGIKLDVIGG